MNRKSISISLCALALLVSAPYDEAAQAASSRACDAYARDYARNASRQGQVVRRGALGGLLGLGIGAAAGGAGAGAAIGGGVGALSGGRARQRTADKIYWAAYRDCMAGRIR
jgi:H+/Cl- antiporter ClcA